MGRMEVAATAAAEGCLWWRLFTRGDRALRLWTCLRAWRAVALRKKRRFSLLTAREQLEVAFHEDDLALHDVVLRVDASDAAVQAQRFAWIRRILEEEPASCEALDRHQRVALHYALAQRWEDPDQLTWLVAKSQRMLLRKDAEGRSLMTQAVLHKCPQEVTMLLAVELAHCSLEAVEALVAGRHFESARRLCRRMVEEFFAGVPHFPHAFCLELLRAGDAHQVIDGLQNVWRAFVDTWGYYGAPVVVEDLPRERAVPLDAFLQLAIRARGEPLAYQWFCDDEPAAGATQATLFVAQSAQSHNAGRYHCEVSNWKGRARSTAVEIVVVDDRFGPDPSLRFLLSDRERASLTDRDDVRSVAASRGALVLASPPPHAASVEPEAAGGIALLLPPKCFASFDARGADVSDAVGMDVVVRLAAAVVLDALSLARGETLVSVVVEVLPLHAPPLALPAVLSIPHNWSGGDADPLHDLVVVEIPVEEDASTAAPGTGRAGRRPRYHEIERSCAEESNRGVSFEISRFGRFAVLARSVGALNKENDKPLENLVLCVAHPSTLSSAAGSKGFAAVACSVWLALDRPDALSALDERLRARHQHDAPADSSGATSASGRSTTRLRLREGQLLHLRAGRKEAISHVWRGTGGCDVSLAASATAISADGVVCLREEISMAAHELELEPPESDDADGSVVVFRVLEVSLLVLKPSRYPTAKPRGLSRSSSDCRPVPDGVVLSERDWKIPLPVLHDLPQVPAQPSLHQRRANQLALAFYTPPPVETGKATGGAALRAPIVLFEELHEMERAFTPYFYQLELARFAETFWQRYDRTWWFDKTKSEILRGMYRVAHSGTEPFAVLATDAFAGAIRVVQCSLDAQSAYSEPYLLEPVQTTGGSGDGNAQGNTTNDGEDDEEDASTMPSGLRRELTLSPSLDLSPLSHASLQRLGTVLDQVYGAWPRELFAELVGAAFDTESVRDCLERQRDSVRAANREVALLVLAMDRLARRLRSRVLFRAKFYARAWAKLSLLRRLVPEVDCFPEEYFSVTVALHTLVRDLFEIAWAWSSPGWFAKLLRNEWFDLELQAIVSRALRLLHNEAQSLQGALEITDVLETFNVVEDDGSGLDFERHTLDRLREYVLLVLGQPSSHLGRREIAALLRQFVPPSIRDRTPGEDWEEHVTSELQSEPTKQALQHLRDHDTLATHLRFVSPRDQERFSGPTFPASISFRFGIHVVHVDIHHALKVKNATLRCGVQGQTEFSREHRRLEFVPALPFDKHTRYQVKLRAQYVHTALGGALPPATMLTFEFSTAA